MSESSETISVVESTTSVDVKSEDSTTASLSLSVDHDEKFDLLLEKRMLPIKELVDSERSYVSTLRIVAEKYIPIVPVTSGPGYHHHHPPPSPAPNNDLSSPASCTNSCANLIDVSSVPDDLIAKWRIIWGNWIQLLEWHSNFLERLEHLLASEEVESIPKLFIDSKPRLRNNYSKYCENHRRAALIAEQYRDFFEEVRVKLCDRQDVVSHLMKPVQRIMRYQLPMEGIVRLTAAARLPSLPVWQQALQIMKDIPSDTQLILEAARIDGFPSSITSLGKVRIRDDLLVASLKPEEYHLVKCHWDQGLMNGGSASGGSAEVEPIKFSDRRVFLFDQTLLITEEVKPKNSSKNVFAQSSYQFVHAVNVNKMRYEPAFMARCFVIHDISPSREVYHIMDPQSPQHMARWSVQLHDIQNMQHELLLALQDPKKFSSSSSTGSGGAAGLTLLQHTSPFFIAPSKAGSLDVNSQSSELHSPAGSAFSFNSGVEHVRVKSDSLVTGSSSSTKESRIRLPSFTNKKKHSRSHTAAITLANPADGPMSMVEQPQLANRSSSSSTNRGHPTIRSSSTASQSRESLPLPGEIPPPPPPPISLSHPSTASIHMGSKKRSNLFFSLFSGTKSHKI